MSQGSPQKGAWVRGGGPSVPSFSNSSSSGLSSKFQTTRQKNVPAVARTNLLGLFEQAQKNSITLAIRYGDQQSISVSVEADSSVKILLEEAISQIGWTDASVDLLADGVVQQPTSLVSSLTSASTIVLMKRLGNRRAFGNGRRFSGRLDLLSSAPSVSDRSSEVIFQVVMPDKTQALVRCERDDSVDSLKGKAVEIFAKKNSRVSKSLAKYEIRTFNGTKIAPVDGKTLCHVLLSDMRSKRSNSLTPSVFLAELISVSAQAKMAEKELGALIGRPLCWTGEQGEVESFRRVMRWVRRQNRTEAGKVKSLLETADGPIERTEFMVNVFLPLVTGGVKKTIKTSTVDSGDDLRVRVFEKYYAQLEDIKSQQLTHADFILKIVGFSDYVDGSELMLEHEFLMKSVYQGEKPLLKLIPRPQEQVEPDEDEWNAEDSESVGTIVYDHKVLSIETMPLEQITVLSVWDLQKHLRVKLVGVDGIVPRVDSQLQVLLEGENIDDSNLTFSVTIGIYHGGSPLRNVRESSQVLASINPRWNEHVHFEDFSICNVPRAARFCITLWCHAPGKSKIPVGWVNFQLFDYKHELRQGSVALSLWTDDEANPIGTCVPNAAPGAPILYLEMDSFAYPVVFPTEPLGQSVNAVAPAAVAPEVAQKLSELIALDPLFQLNEEERELVWKNRMHLVGIGKGLQKLIASVPIDDYKAVQEMHRIVDAWPPLGPFEALELLDSRFADAYIRNYAVSKLESFTESQVQDFLLQLVQVLKYEPYHDSALARFLVRRALRSRRIGHVLFWYLKAEMHVSEITERYGLLLEAYLRGVPEFRKDLYKQTTLLGVLEESAKSIKEKDVLSADKLDVMARGLMKLKFPDPIQLPLSPMFKVSSINIPKCKIMDSKKQPLWLTFTNADSDGDDIKVIFKEGDDLRQDMLTLQMIRIMDRMWRNHGLDLQMSPYGCISTGNEVGFIEVVLNADTTAHISREAGGARAAFQEEPLANWLKLHNPTPTAYEKAQRRFMHSCAGYCVATYCLGIGDRHNDNIMVTRTGRLFHIDFGHFLGNYKTKFGIKRERAPFVLTPDFAYVMGGKGSPEFKEFIKLCCNAYNVVRKNANLFINLFSMMLSTGIPELMRPSDIHYLRDAFSAELDDAQAAIKFENLINESLGTLTTQMNNFTHILAH